LSLQQSAAQQDAVEPVARRGEEGSKSCGGEEGSKSCADKWAVRLSPAECALLDGLERTNPEFSRHLRDP